MKKLISLLIVTVLVLILAACGGSETDIQPEDRIEISILSSPSLAEVLTDIAGLYEAAEPAVTISFSFASASSLAEQIKEGTVCDIFLSNDSKQLNLLDASCANGEDYIQQGSRVSLAEDRVSLAVTEDNPKAISSFEQLRSGLDEGTLKAAAGNSDNYISSCTQRLLSYFELDADAMAEAGLLICCDNVKDIVNAVTAAKADCGIIFGTDAVLWELQIVDSRDGELCGSISYQAAVMKSSEHSAAAGAFLEYLHSAEAAEIFTKYGLTPMQD